MRVRGHTWSLKVVSFESLSAVSYSLSIATMAVYLAVLTQYTNVTDRQTPHDGIGRAYACNVRQKPEIFSGLTWNKSTRKQVGVAATLVVDGKDSQAGRTPPARMLQSLAQRISASASQLSLQHNTTTSTTLRPRCSNNRCVLRKCKLRQGCCTVALKRGGALWRVRIYHIW